MGMQKNFIRRSKVQRVEMDLNLVVNMLSQFANRVYACEAMIKQLNDRMDQAGLPAYKKPEDPAPKPTEPEPKAEAQGE